jgi:type IV secretory pathway VirB4 component
METKSRNDLEASKNRDDIYLKHLKEIKEEISRLTGTVESYGDRLQVIESRNGAYFQQLSSGMEELLETGERTEVVALDLAATLSGDSGPSKKRKLNEEEEVISDGILLGSARFKAARLV